jgi:hypothetical protein
VPDARPTEPVQAIAALVAALGAGRQFDDHLYSLKDRAVMVRLLALDTAVRRGDARLLPALQRIVDAPRTSRGERARAIGAIQAIEGRERRTPPGND